MARLLFLAHRLPYPPNKGDKVRSHHVLRHLAASHEVFVGTFVDDPADEEHVAVLRGMCAGLHVSRLDPRFARVASLMGLFGDDALTLRYYRDEPLRRWVRRTAEQERIDGVVVFSSSMAQYAQDLGLPMLVDLVDVDSAKWTSYSARSRWPMSWIYRREGEKLLAYERAIASAAMHTYLVTDKEVAFFGSLAPECVGRVEAVGNGVDAEYFAPSPDRASPFAADEMPVVFTGAMDYWPNADAVIWFASEVLPALRMRRPRVRLHVVGRNPTPAIQRLAGEAVSVTGTVPDVRPYLQHAAVIVAPLRVARGIQNKVLEAMAAGRPVVAAVACVDAVDAQAGAEIVPAATAEDFVREVDALLADPLRAAAIGEAGRLRVLRDYSWTARLSPLDRHLQALDPTARLAA